MPLHIMTYNGGTVRGEAQRASQLVSQLVPQAATEKEG